MKPIIQAPTVFTITVALVAMILLPSRLAAQTNPLWHTQKVKNYLPHMTVPEVRDLLTRTDMVIIPVASLEQHGLHLPIGTDFLNGVERAKLVAQRTDVLVAPILFPGQPTRRCENGGGAACLATERTLPLKTGSTPKGRGGRSCTVISKN